MFWVFNFFERPARMPEELRPLTIKNRDKLQENPQAILRDCLRAGTQ